MRHVAPEYHPAFYSSSRLTLNVTRRAMADTGFCPSGRLFEAAACGAPILSDNWEGLDAFFTPGEEILVAHDTADTVAALDCGDDQLAAMSRAARERTLTEHTAARRALELEQLLEDDTRVGNHSGGRRGHADSAAGLLEGAVTGRMPDRRHG
jgi:spore maturation protein CgeB